MSEEDEDICPELLKVKLLQVGPMARGYACAYLVPVESEESPDEELYTVRVSKVDSFGLGELTWSRGFTVEPVSLILDEGMWIVADTLPGYVGTFVDEGDARDMEKTVQNLCKQLDPYYAKRLVQGEAIDE